jgi:hypothetical protein
LDSKTIADIALTVALAIFAGLTWWATRTYGYITGLSLFVQANKEISGVTKPADPAMAKRTMRAIKKQFPRVYRDMRDCLNADAQKEIEER